MSLPFVIEALLVARRARRDGAFERLRECRTELRDAESAREKIALNLNRTSTLRGECIVRLSAMAAGRNASSVEDAHAEEHIAMLGARVDEIRAQLSRAEHAVAKARTKVEHAIAEFMRTHEQLDAVLEQKAQWESAIDNGEPVARQSIAAGGIVDRFGNRR